LVPVDGRGDRGAGRRARAVRGDERLVDGVLGVVQPGQAAPLVDLPLPADQLRYDRADAAGQPLHPGTGGGEVGAGHDGYPDLDAAAAGQLRSGAHAEVLERVPVQPGEEEQVRPGRGVARVEVDQCVRGRLRVLDA